METKTFQKRSNKIGVLFIAVILLLMQAACLSSSTATSSAVVDETKISLGVAATSNALKQTEDAMEKQAENEEEERDLQRTMDAIALQQTMIALEQENEDAPSLQSPVEIVPPVIETPMPTNPPDPMAGMDEKIRNAKVLVFEDTNELGIGEWIEETLLRMGIKDYVQTYDRSGDFMEQLNSPTKWDLIIIGAESKTKVQGEFWEVIMTHVYKKTAIIAEIWYLDLLGGGKIKSFTNECGVAYASNYDLAESIYWWDTESPVFTTPNNAMPLIHYSRYWNNQCGDKMRTTGSGDAQLLAGWRAKPDSRGGLIASCMGGRTIIQTFSNHDYHEDQIKDLWENYITYTLTNHFLAIQ